MTEKQIEQSLVKSVKECHGLCIKLTSPSLDGIPDRLVLLPEGKCGFVECKAPGKKPRPLQVKRRRQLQRLGFKVYVLDNKKRIKELIDDIQSA